MPFKSAWRRIKTANENAFCYYNLYIKVVIFYSFQVLVENFFSPSLHTNDNNHKKFNKLSLNHFKMGVNASQIPPKQLIQGDCDQLNPISFAV